MVEWTSEPTVLTKFKELRTANFEVEQLLLSDNWDKLDNELYKNYKFDDNDKIRDFMLNTFPKLKKEYNELLKKLIELRYSRDTDTKPEEVKLSEEWNLMDNVTQEAFDFMLKEQELSDKDGYEFTPDKLKKIQENIKQLLIFHLRFHKYENELDKKKTIQYQKDLTDTMNKFFEDSFGEGEVSENIQKKIRRHLEALGKIDVGVEVGEIYRILNVYNLVPLNLISKKEIEKKHEDKYTETQLKNARDLKKFELIMLKYEFLKFLIDRLRDEASVKKEKINIPSLIDLKEIIELIKIKAQFAFDKQLETLSNKKKKYENGIRDNSFFSTLSDEEQKALKRDKEIYDEEVKNVKKQKNEFDKKLDKLLKCREVNDFNNFINTCSKELYNLGPGLKLDIEYDLKRMYLKPKEDEKEEERKNEIKNELENNKLYKKLLEKIEDSATIPELKVMLEQVHSSTSVENFPRWDYIFNIIREQRRKYPDVDLNVPQMGYTGEEPIYITYYDVLLKYIKGKKKNFYDKANKQFSGGAPVEAASQSNPVLAPFPIIADEAFDIFLSDVRNRINELKNKQAYFTIDEANRWNDTDTKLKKDLKDYMNQRLLPEVYIKQKDLHTGINSLGGLTPEQKTKLKERNWNEVNKMININKAQYRILEQMRSTLNTNKAIQANRERVQLRFDSEKESKSDKPSDPMKPKYVETLEDIGRFDLDDFDIEENEGIELQIYYDEEGDGFFSAKKHSKNDGVVKIASSLDRSIYPFLIEEYLKRFKGIEKNDQNWKYKRMVKYFKYDKNNEQKEIDDIINIDGPGFYDVRILLEQTNDAIRSPDLHYDVQFEIYQRTNIDRLINEDGILEEFLEKHIPLDKYTFFNDFSRRNMSNAQYEALYLDEEYRKAFLTYYYNKYKQLNKSEDTDFQQKVEFDVTNKDFKNKQNACLTTDSLQFFNDNDCINQYKKNSTEDKKLLNEKYQQLVSMSKQQTDALVVPMEEIAQKTNSDTSTSNNSKKIMKEIAIIGGLLVLSVSLYTLNQKLTKKSKKSRKKDSRK